MGGSEFISVLLKSNSPVVSRFFAITQNKVKSHLHSSETKCYHVILIFNIAPILLLNWDNIPVTVGISFSTGSQLFTFLVEQSIATSSSCTHAEASFSGRLSQGHVQALWRNG